MGMALIEMLVVVAGLSVLAPAAVLFIQVLLARQPEGSPLPQGAPRPSVAIVMPAHNESLMIAGTLRSLLPQLGGGDRLIVVADNCSDDTAAVAAACGAEVIERTDAQRRGKGYALDFGVRHLGQAPREVVIIVDADCEVGSGAIDRLATLCRTTGRPVQALYLMHAPNDSGLKMRIAEFAWLVKNQVRPMGYHRMGLPCQLDGTGMAFPWAVISNAMLATGHIVEDMKLGIDLARDGTPALFCPEARVTSYFPATAEGVASQRTRWEHGHLGMILGSAPSLLAEGLVRRNLALIALALDLSVPPLALLLLLILAVLAGGGLWFAASGSILPMWPAAASLLLFALSVVLAWSGHGRHVVSFASLAYAPLYALRKIPVYLAFMVRRQGEWVRSRRDKG
jgi:cellulose synthase/poly-beta-1,6-N-acetylglucosamine synthase-like glycosyltransferase